MRIATRPQLINGMYMRYIANCVMVTQDENFSSMINWNKTDYIVNDWSGRHCIIASKPAGVLGLCYDPRALVHGTGEVEDRVGNRLSHVYEYICCGLSRADHPLSRAVSAFIWSIDDELMTCCNVAQSLSDGMDIIRIELMTRRKRQLIEIIDDYEMNEEQYSVFIRIFNAWEKDSGKAIVDVDMLSEYIRNLSVNESAYEMSLRCLRSVGIRSRK